MHYPFIIFPLILRLISSVSLHYRDKPRDTEDIDPRDEERTKEVYGMLRRETLNLEGSDMSLSKHILTVQT